MLLINFFEIKNIIYYDTINSQKANFDKYFVRSTISDPNASVVLIDSWLGDRLWTAFWLPYNYTMVYDLPKGSVVKKEMIPAGTQYIVLFDEYQFDFSVNQVAKKKNCAIFCPQIKELGEL